MTRDGHSRAGAAIIISVEVTVSHGAAAARHSGWPGSLSVTSQSQCCPLALAGRSLAAALAGPG